MLLTPLFSWLGLSWLSAKQNARILTDCVGKKSKNARNQRNQKTQVRITKSNMPERPLHSSSYTSSRLSRQPFTQSFHRLQKMLLGLLGNETLVQDMKQFHRTGFLKSYKINIPTFPLSLTATFSTAPPCSYVIGGVSLHPPERSIRAEFKHLIV